MSLTAEATTLRERLDGVAGLRAVASMRSGRVGGVPGGAVALLAWWLGETTGAPTILVGTDPESLAGDAALWAGTARLGLFPAADTPPFDRVPPSEEVTRRRLAALALLGDGGSAPLVVASPAGLLRPALPPDLVRGEALHLRAGDRQPRDSVVRRALELGYRRVSAVSAPGEVAVRGGIVDVFGLDRMRPWRAEWVGDDVEEIRAFDVGTQTSVARLDAVALWPARELDLRPASVSAAVRRVDALDVSSCRPEVREAWDRDRMQLAEGLYDDGLDLFYPYLVGDEPSTLLDHAGADAIVLLAGGREAFMRAARRHFEEIEGLRAQEEERGELPAGARTGLLLPDAVAHILELRRAIEIVREPDGDHVLGWQGVDSHVGRVEAFARAARARTATGATVLVVSRQQHRIEELVRDAGLDPVDVDDLDAAGSALPAGALVVAGGDLSQGFSTGDANLDVHTDHELFGAVKRRGSPLARGARRAESTSARGARRASGDRAAHTAFTMQFTPGDVVVHRDHGIGRFVEMRTVSDALGEHEYMVVEYADQDRLFVPVDHLDRVDRYVGGADSRPALSKLGTGEWERTKRRVRERTEEVARELLALYSRREAAPGHAFLPDSEWQRELEASFPYQETPDQEMVLDEIKRDMEASRPMDRVVCGDVGFGKTELALRAAFKAASEGRQVAVLVPTTVLAQQHYLTFSERLAPFPVTVRQLSRFCSDAEVAETLTGLRGGGVDVVVGTHRLLQRDVEFRNLGLVIVDEEQRFGVMQKERFKSLRLAVDVLSLSATPIPRTLHMSLAGIRDLSVIQTPPEERQPIKTYVTAREDSLVREVITRELARGGQVFFLHNRVQTIEKHAEDVRRLVPEARVAVGHGQMPEHALADVMRAFGDGDIDVLVCTTIIESGLDIPNANTIVINDAHRLGLAQLYQLRGRVGRAGQRAYAYLLYPPEKSLTERADRRLDVIGELQDLGAGFKLAMHDLEIRGAGNLLGEEQHGEIAAVGLELYNTLLRQAVTALQGKPVVESPVQVSVSLPLRAFLPVDYVTDERLRLRCYQDLAACASEPDLDRAARGLADRFGPLPAPAEALVYSLRVRLLAASAGATSVESGDGGVRVQLPVGHGLDLAAVAAQWRRRATASATRIVVSSEDGWRDVLLDALRELGRLRRQRERPAAG